MREMKFNKIYKNLSVADLLIKTSLHLVDTILFLFFNHLWSISDIDSHSCKHLEKCHKTLKTLPNETIQCNLALIETSQCNFISSK